MRCKPPNLYLSTQLCFKIHMLILAQHSAHWQCQSLDHLISSRLQDLLDTATFKAKAHQQQLLLHHLSDLLQIKTSYIHDGQELQLILHISITPADSILCHIQLHPFPLPFTNTLSLMPDLKSQILANSSGPDHLTLKMSVVKLMGCHCISSVYLCLRPTQSPMQELNLSGFLVWNIFVCYSYIKNGNLTIPHTYIQNKMLLQTALAHSGRVKKHVNP